MPQGKAEAGTIDELYASFVGDEMLVGEGQGTDELDYAAKLAAILKRV